MTNSVLHMGYSNRQTLSRRCFLQAGGLGVGGLALTDLMRLRAQGAIRPSAAGSNVILFWLSGGPGHMETWDPKPDAPQDYRGAFGAMRTSVPGVQICDLLPMSAKIQHKYSVIRSLHHTDAGHSAGDQIMFTGHPPGQNVEQNAYPSCGSIVAKELGHLNPKLPPYVIIPRNLPGSGPAYLGSRYGAFETQADPAKDGPFSLPNFSPVDGLSFDRLDERRKLLGSFDQIRRDVDASGTMGAMDSFQQKAWDIVGGPDARKAFDLDAEPLKIRERYGFMPEYIAPTPDRCGVPAWSQRMLLARRLVESGVRLVTVDLRWWDTHVKGYETMRDGFLPRWDRAYSAIIEDLDQRGMLDNTMVIAWGEFGRTPRVNATGGRDHYPNVFSAALAGGGIKGGRVIGSSDKQGAYPADNPKTAQDVLATMYRHLGIDSTKSYDDLQGRPHPILPSGTPVDELFA